MSSRQDSLSYTRIALIVRILALAALAGALSPGLGARVVQARGILQVQPHWPSAPSPQADLPALKPRSCSQEHSLRSVASTHPTWVLFKNKGTRTVSLYWLNSTGQRVFYAQLAPAATWEAQTYARHPWMVASIKGTGLGSKVRCIEIFVAKRKPSQVDIQ